MQFIYIFTGILLLFTVTFILKGVQEYLALAKDKNLKLGLVLFVILLQLGLVINIYLFNTPGLSFLIWFAGVILIRVFRHVKIKNYRDVKKIINYLNQYPEYKDIADNLFVGFIYFKNDTPLLINNKQRKIYEKGFADFRKLNLPDNDPEILEIQNITRKCKLYSWFLLSLFAAWCLQLPTFIIIAFIK